MTSVRTRVAALAVAAAAALLPLAGPVSSYAAGSSPSPTTSPNDDAPAQILVTKLAPRAPLDPEGFFQVRGFVTNRGSQTLHELTVRLRRGEKLSSRDELATADTEPPATETRVGRTPVRAAQQDLDPGARTSFDIRIRVRDLEMGAVRPGVYPLKIEAQARFGDGGSVEPVGSVMTFIPWFPEGPPHGRVRIAWLWPLVDQPRRGPREVMLDDTLATSFAKGGRLDRMLRGAADGAHGGCDVPPDPPSTVARPPVQLAPCRGESVPVTYAVDPDLLFTADAMSRAPYQLLQPNGQLRRIDDVAPARTWLDTLRSAPGDVLALPYADPDPVALTAPENGLADEVSELLALGRAETTRLLRAPLTTVVWPPSGRLTRRAVEALGSGGADAVVVDQTALPAPETSLSSTPDTDVGPLPTSTGSPSVLTVDPVLSALLTPASGTDPSTYPGDRLAEQRWLAETAMISAEEPSVSRTILVAPDRRADLHPAVAADTLRDTGRLPWLCPVSLASVAARTDTCLGETRPQTTPASPPPVELEPPHPDDALLSSHYLAKVRSLRRLSTQFTDEVLAAPTSTEAVGTTGRLARARARTESSAWRNDPADGERLLSQLQEDLTALRNKVHLQIGSGTVTLTSSSGVISVNVVNELSQPVRVGVTLNPGNRARLSTLETPITTVGPGRASQITLKVTAQTSGTFPVTARLVDRTGHPFGVEQRLIVRSTHYGRVALAVTGIAAGVLLVAAGLRVVRRALHRSRPQED